LLKLLVTDHPLLPSDQMLVRIITHEEFTPVALASDVVRA
jgi:hypothetical protein